MADDDDSKWHLDKKVPIALMSTIVFQTMVFIWGASNLWTRVGELERQQTAAVPRLESVIRLEAKVDNISGSLTEIKAALVSMAAGQKEVPRR